MKRFLHHFVIALMVLAVENDPWQSKWPIIRGGCAWGYEAERLNHSALSAALGSVPKELLFRWGGENPAPTTSGLLRRHRLI